MDRKAGEGTSRQSFDDPARTGGDDREKGDPDYIALDLLLDDGSRQLFWHYEMEDDHAE